MKLLKIKRKWLNESDLRLDAEFHLSDGPLTKLKFKESPYIISTLGQETKEIFKGNIFKRTYVSNEEFGFQFMTASDMMKSDIKGGKYVSKKHTKTANLFIKKDWILVSRSGTLGNVVFTNKDFENILGTDDLIRIVANDERMLRGCVYAFLASKYGYGLITQSSYGGVVQHIEPHHLENLPIPIFPKSLQKEINELILKSAKMREAANSELNEAISYFNESISVSRTNKIFIKKIKNLGYSWASYNNNIECDEIEKSLKEHLTIKDVAIDCFSPLLFKHIYLKKDNGHPFLTGAELTKFIKKYYRWLSPRGVKNIENYKVKKGTLLLYKSGTTDGGILGNVFIADDILDGTCLSDHVIRIFLEDLKMSYWMFAFFKSNAGIKLLQKTATGSMIPFITAERLMDVKFPKPNSKYEWIAQKIENYITESVSSQRNELKAISFIEKEIESWQK
jgi:restriction endonuclease S subunit